MDARSILENQVELLVAASKENAGLDSRHLADLTTALLSALEALWKLNADSSRAEAS
ncbi:MAG: hypothetical protein VB099_21120 [Candidatus Limiplasma sp.]|nr:hypothetical protein [Candidatus Limiplasma sp.]